MGIEGDVVSCLYNHVITHNLWNSSNVYCVLFIFICFSVSSSILCGILPLSSLIPNIFSKEFLSLRHLILGNKDQSHASTHHKLWNKSLFSILSNSCLHLLFVHHLLALALFLFNFLFFIIFTAKGFGDGYLLNSYSLQQILTHIIVYRLGGLTT